MTRKLYVTLGNGGSRLVKVGTLYVTFGTICNVRGRSVTVEDSKNVH
jgi:hypothetical protein